MSHKADIRAEVDVRTSGGSHKITIGEGLFSLAARKMAEISGVSRWAVVTDSNVRRIHISAFLSEIAAETEGKPVQTEVFSFPAGEESKNRETKSRIEDEMLQSGFGRDSGIVALGGGVVGDLAGFVAATYCRGVPLIQIPTTLVACVDSAIGGKTGVDTPAGKNLIGAFHQPLAVYADMSLLSTLPDSGMREGAAEVIKYGVIKDAELFGFLEENIAGLLAKDTETVAHVVEKSCRIKADVVEKDEKERDLRKILNFGHTVGHAVEKLSGYTVSHGEAVGIGMVKEAEIAVSMGLLPRADAERIRRLVSAAGLPVAVPERFDGQPTDGQPTDGQTAGERLTVERLFEAMKLDKKTRGGSVEMALPRRIGEMATVDGQHGITVRLPNLRAISG